MVGHRIDIRRHLIDTMHLRIVQEFADHLVDTMVERGREQHMLRVGANLLENAFDRRQEAHVGHLVGLVEHHDAHIGECQRLLFNQILRRPGQATTMSAPSSRSRNCRSYLTPPYTVVTAMP